MLRPCARAADWLPAVPIGTVCPYHRMLVHASVSRAALSSSLGGGWGPQVHWSDGSRYEGFWRRGMPSGWGVYQWSSGNKFHGEFRAGKRHGVGRFVWGATGEVYVGTWCQDQRDGHGLYTWQVYRALHTAGWDWTDPAPACVSGGGEGTRGV